MEDKQSLAAPVSFSLSLHLLFLSLLGSISADSFLFISSVSPLSFHLSDHCLCITLWIYTVFSDKQIHIINSLICHLLLPISSLNELIMFEMSFLCPPPLSLASHVSPRRTKETSDDLFSFIEVNNTIIAGFVNVSRPHYLPWQDVIDISASLLPFSS